MRRLVRCAPVLLATVALVACGETGGTPASDPVAASDTATPAPTSAPAPTAADTPEPDPPEPAATTEADTQEEAVVTIAGFAFEPETIEVAVGTTVTWTNDDSTAHTATVADDGPDTGSISGGASASLTFETAGTYDYVCAFHPGSMTGTVVVR